MDLMTVPATFESSRVSAASVGQLFSRPVLPVAGGKQSKSGKILLHQDFSPLFIRIRET